MKIIATSDLHIGRRPTQVSPEDADRYSCANLWERMVELAISEHVTALLLAGDTVDEENKFFEALGPLERGLRRLGEHGIVTVAVTGNHDYDVLTTVADVVGRNCLRILGLGGWETLTLTAEDGQRLDLFGWSFPTRYVESSPLRDFPGAIVTGNRPCLGLVHADVGAAQSPYCPAMPYEFDATGVASWIVGHVHKPDMITTPAGTRILTTGSPQGLDPGMGEVGRHGPWILDFSQAPPSAELTALAPLRYERIPVVLDGIASANELRNTLVASATSHLRELCADDPALRLVSARLSVTGRTALRPGLVEQALRELAEAGLHERDVRMTVNDWNINLRPPIELEKIAGERGLLSELARLILQLEGDEPLGGRDQELVDAVARAAEQVEQAAAFSALPGNDAGPDNQAVLSHTTARKLAAEQAWLLLDELLQQHPTGAEDG